MASRVGTNSVQLLYLFLVFQLLDQIFLLILIVTFVLARSVKRHPTVVNVCLTWFITGVVSCLLLYAGKHVGPEPPKLLCISQASLLDGVVPMNAVAVLALMFQVNFGIRNCESHIYGMRTYTLLIMPYITFFFFSTSAAILAVQQPESVSRSRRFFYCSFQSPITNILAVFSALVLLTAFGYAIALAIFFRKNWNTLRQSGKIDLPFLSRFAVFGIYVFISLLLSVLSIFAPQSPFPDLFVASVGLALFFFLGTHPDVWRVWLRRSTPAPPRVTESWMASVGEVSTTHGLGSGFNDKTESRAYDFVAEDIEASQANDLGLEGTTVKKSSRSAIGRTDDWVTAVREDTITHDLHFGDFTGRVESSPHLDIEGMEAPKVHDQNSKHTNVARGPSSARREAGVVQNDVPWIPRDRSRRPRRPPLVVNDSNSKTSPGASPGVNVVPYRFARPGMI